MNYEKDARALCFAAALLFLIAALTGLLVAAAMTGKIDANGHFMLASHLNALLGCFWLLGLAFTLKWVRLSDKSTALLLISAVVSAYANWLVTLIKAFVKVQGIDFTGEGRNDAIFITLTLLVVIPTLVSAGLWVQGLRKRATS